MRAAVLRNIGDNDLEFTDALEIKEPGPDEVIVKITHAGICHSDLSAMNGTIPQKVPAVLGHEGAGIVESVGSQVGEVAIGDRVIVAWSPPCGACPYCTAWRQPHLCRSLQEGSMLVPHFREGNAEVQAMAGVGTFAEQTLLPKQAVVKIDDDIPLDVASLIGCAVMTGVGAILNTCRVSAGSSVIVYGCGGVGISAIQGARLAGAAEILAVDVRTEKLDEALRFGATQAVRPSGVKRAKRALHGSEGFDFAVECVGNPATMRSAFDAIRRGGTCCIVGVGRPQEMLKFNAFELFYSGKTIVGSYYGGADVRQDFQRLLQFYRQGKLDLEGMITRRLGLEEVNTALQRVRQGEVVRQVIEF